MENKKSLPSKKSSSPKTLVFDKTSLFNGHRLFFNKDFANSDYRIPYIYETRCIEFKQLFYEDLLLDDQLTFCSSKWTLTAALVTTFTYDSNFIEPNLEAKNTKMLVYFSSGMAETKESEDIRRKVAKTGYSKLSKQHAKLMLLKFPTFLRVVVSSANCTSVDWWLLSQNVWFQDFPLQKTESSEFKENLIEFLSSLSETPKDDINMLGIDLEDYDFSQASVKLIFSLSGETVSGLRMISEQVKAAISSTIIVSSIGMLSDSFLSAAEKVLGKVSLIFPTKKFVLSVSEGTNMIFCSQKTYETRKDQFFCYNSKNNVLFHGKLFLIKAEKTEWIYAGSHNFSVSALGTLAKSKATNTELGVLMDLSKLSADERTAINDAFPFSTALEPFEEDLPYLN